MTLTREQEECSHTHIQSWHFEDGSGPAGMWSCKECGLKFVPITKTDAAFNAERARGLGEAKEAEADKWKSAMFTIHGHAQVLMLDGQQDMPLYLMELAELIAATHVDDWHAQRMRELRAAAIEQLKEKT